MQLTDLDTERFVAMVSRSSEDYASWHCRHFNDGLSARDLVEKVKAFAARKRLRQTVHQGVSVQWQGTSFVVGGCVGKILVGGRRSS